MNRHRVLIADDHLLISEGVRATIEPEFEVVGMARDGREVLEQAAQLLPDMIVLDIGMPSLNGIEAARRLKQEFPQIKLIFLTQKDDRSYLHAAFSAEASGYVLKSGLVSEIALALREAMAGRFYVSPQLLDEGSLDGLQADRNPSELFGKGLTERQREVLQMVAEGKTAKEIAATLHISPKTVEYHKAGIMQELGIHTTAELTRYALEHGIVKE